MIIMLNGSFGVGKSTVAQALCDAIPNTMLYDPEIAGQALRYWTVGLLTPEEQTDDFQDIALWPSLSVVVADQLYRHYRRSLIVPMTLAHHGYLDTIRSGLARIAPPLYHFCLTAPPEVIYRRLHDRDDGGDPSWAWRKAQQYVPIFAHERYAVHIDTDGVPVEAIVARIQSYIQNGTTS